MKTEKKVKEYLNWCREGKADPRFYGYLPFKILWKLDLLAPWYSNIRIMYTGLVDICYWVNDEGFLVQMGVEDAPALDPKKILSKRLHPRGWEPISLKPQP